jgi:hypothetical protein
MISYKTKQTITFLVHQRIKQQRKHMFVASAGDEYSAHAARQRQAPVGADNGAIVVAAEVWR